MDHKMDFVRMRLKFYPWTSLGSFYCKLDSSYNRSIPPETLVMKVTCILTTDVLVGTAKNCEV
jgi:hypothetical protein